MSLHARRTWVSALRRYASLHLAHHILHSPSILFPALGDTGLPDMVELGAGTGFLSILLAQLGARVTATDLGDASIVPTSSPSPSSSHTDHHVASQAGEDAEIDDPEETSFRCEGEYCRQTPLAWLKYNVRLNSLDGPVRVEPLDWMDSIREEGERPVIWDALRRGRRRRTALLDTKGFGHYPTTDGLGLLDGNLDGNVVVTIIAADVIYDPDLIPPLVSTISYLLGSPASPTLVGLQDADDIDERQAIVAATVRNESTLGLFEQTCGEYS